MNYDYAKDNDILFLTPPIWMRFVTGLSAFVYAPFYLILLYALIKDKNRIQVPAIIIWFGYIFHYRSRSFWGRVIRRAAMALPESGQISSL
jgi:hypothetical protein